MLFAAALLVSICTPLPLLAQALQLASASLPDAPLPAPGAGSPLDAQTASSSSQDAPSAAQAVPPPASETAAQKTERERAADQVKKQEQQRVLGVVPNFNVAYDKDAPPITPKQKFNLALHTATDPWAFGIAALDALYSQATDDFGPEFHTKKINGVNVVVRDEAYGQGIQGYAKRFGAAYADNFDGTLIGNAIFPVLLKEDPRYFRRGYGTTRSRILYAISTTVWCKRDNGNWGPNYANILGNLAAGGISNLYYPSPDRGLGLTLSRGFTVTAYGTFGGLANEFLPDITRHLLHRDVSGKRAATP